VAANFQESVAAAGILIHFTQFAPEVIPGIFCFLFEGLSTRDVTARPGFSKPEATIVANLPD
jgi:hypothetical protein